MTNIPYILSWKSFATTFLSPKALKASFIPSKYYLKLLSFLLKQSYSINRHFELFVAHVSPYNYHHSFCFQSFPVTQRSANYGTLSFIILLHSTNFITKWLCFLCPTHVQLLSTRFTSMLYILSLLNAQSSFARCRFRNRKESFSHK